MHFHILSKLFWNINFFPAFLGKIYEIEGIILHINISKYDIIPLSSYKLSCSGNIWYRHRSAIYQIQKFQGFRLFIITIIPLHINLTCAIIFLFDRSTFKPVIAAIGLQSEAFTGTDNFGNEGHSWQKDKTWGTYHVTTLHTYSPVILKNALIYSDNIYFAKAALKIGTEEMERSLSMLGFHSSIPFEIMMAESKFSNNKHIQSEVGLADTGYGQGQVLVNPLHLACIYTSFCNDGNVLKPYLLYKENAKAEQWISEAFSKSVSQEVLEGIKSVVNDSHGTGYAIHRKDMILAGKTGTAEIKESQSDTTGTELGWFAVMTPDKKNKKPILIVSMVEDVKGIGGSGYVVKKDKAVLDKWFGKN